MAVDKLILHLDRTGRALIYYNGIQIAQGQVDISVEDVCRVGTRFQLQSGNSVKTNANRLYQVVAFEGAVEPRAALPTGTVTAVVEYVR